METISVPNNTLEKSTKCFLFLLSVKMYLSLFFSALYRFSSLNSLKRWEIITLPCEAGTNWDLYCRQVTGNSGIQLQLTLWRQLMREVRKSMEGRKEMRGGNDRGMKWSSLEMRGRTVEQRKEIWTEEGGGSEGRMWDSSFRWAISMERDMRR